jgi:hypothetical protein
MNKTYLLLVCLLSLVCEDGLHGQSFGIRAGINFPGMLDKDEDEVYSDNNKIILRIHAGGVYDYAITRELSVEASLLMSVKGVKNVEVWDDIKYIKKLNLLYLDIPVTARYTLDLDNFKLYALFGPYLAFGLSGKYKYTEEQSGGQDTRQDRVKWGNDPDEDDLRIADGGFHFGAGTMFGNIQAGLFYELGVFNISSNTEYNKKIKNRTLGLTAVYYFKSKP